SFFLSLLPPPPCFPLFPYTTLFRSIAGWPPATAILATSRRAARPGRAVDARLLLQLETVDWIAAMEIVHRHEHWRNQMQATQDRSEEHTSELQSRVDLVCRLLLEKK